MIIVCGPDPESTFLDDVKSLPPSAQLESKTQLCILNSRRAWGFPKKRQLYASGQST